MRKSILILVIGFSFLFFPFFVLITPVSAIGITANSYYFFIDEPTTIDFEELIFYVKNTENEPIEVKCGYDVIEGINVSVELDWTSIIIEPQKSIANHFIIHVGESFNITFPVQISVVGYSLNNETGNKLIGAAIVTNFINYYSEESGYYMDLRIVDQSGRPRIADIKLEHKFNTSYPYTPIKRINASTLTGYFPKGWYSILARDSETGRTGAKQFYLGNDSIIDVEIQLVGFSYFEPIGDSRNHLGINATINNFVSMLYEVEIFAELFLNGEKLDETNKDYWQEFPQVSNHRIKLWFSFDEWMEADYEIFAYIYSMGEKIAEKFKIVSIRDVVQVSNEIPIELVIIATFIGGIAVAIIFSKLDKKRMDNYYVNLQEIYKKYRN